MGSLNLTPEAVLAGVVFALVKLIGYWFLARWIGRNYRPAIRAAPALAAC